jgi:hypothetical protein
LFYRTGDNRLGGKIVSDKNRHLPGGDVEPVSIAIKIAAAAGKLAEGAAQVDSVLKILIKL